MNRLEAIRELAKHDHGILSPEAAQELGDPFGVTVVPQTFETGQGRVVQGLPGRWTGVTVVPQTFETGQGRVVQGPPGRWTGVAAHRLAHQIAASLGLQEGRDYPSQTGIGSQLRVACQTVERYLESQD